MVGTGVLVYGMVYALVFTFAVFPFIVPVYAATIENLKFDQEEIPRGHSDVITLIESPSDVISFEDFEDANDIWVNADGETPENNCWWYRDRPTGTGNTGPSDAQPHTGAPSPTQPLGTLRYIFYESSGGASGGCSPGIGQQGFLDGPKIDFTAFNSVEVEFSLHMWDGQGDDNVGKLELYLEDSPNSGTFTPGPQNPVWSEDVRQVDDWVTITIPLTSADNTGPRLLRFVVTEQEQGIHSDIAIDEITIRGIRTSPSPIVISFEDFEDANDIWVNADGETPENNCWWYRDRPTGTGNTGPSDAQPHTGAPSPTQPLGTLRYIFYESSGGASGGCSPGIGQQGFLDGPIINFTAFNSVEVEFSLHMWDGQGDDNVGKLELYLEDRLGSRTFTNPSIWSEEFRIVDDWVTINVPPLTSADNTGPRLLRFVVTEQEQGIHSDIAIDEITIRGVPTDITVTVQSFATSTSSQPLERIDIPLPQRVFQGGVSGDLNIFWQVVEFDDTTDELNRQLLVHDGETVRVNFTDLYWGEAVIVEPDAMPLLTKKEVLNNNPAFCNDPAAGLGGDVDEDGICDAWEPDPATGPMVIEFPPGNTYTMDTSPGGVCESFLQVDPPVKCYGSDQRDIYLEIDYMVGHKPNEEALYELIEAFANAPSSTDPNVVDPIRLHIQLVTNSTGPIGHQDCIDMPGNNFDHGFDQIREMYYGTEFEHAQPQPPPPPPPALPLQYDWGFLQKKQIFHYALFAHSECGETSSGKAEYRGNDIMITLGTFTGGIGNPDEQAGTLMHELGHNLNITHGGSEAEKDIGCKPNYLSVMSYTRQFPILNAYRSLDFSREALTGPLSPGNSLHEDLLREPGGVDVYTHNPDEGIIYGPIAAMLPPPSGGNIDWNGIGGANEMGPYSFDVNYFPGIEKCDVQANTELMGYNDWDRNIMNLTVRDSGAWEDGRSIKAKFNPAVWEDGASPYPSVLSPTCPSVQQILDWADPNVLGNASDPTLPGHKLAKEKIKAHLNNYRICASGAGETDILKLKTGYSVSMLYSVRNIVEYYAEDPSKLIDEFLKHYDKTPSGILEQILEFFATKSLDKTAQEKLQFHYSVVDTILVEHGNSLEPNHKTKLEDVKTIIEDKANFFNVQLNQTSLEEFIKVEPIYATSDLTTESVKKMREFRVDSMKKYLENVPEIYFTGNKNATINGYYEPEFVKIRNFIQLDNYGEAAMVMANLDHAAKIQDATTLQDLELATDTIIDQYTRAIPEFGTIVSLILVASISCIIILTTKTRNIFMPRNFQ